jgi:hypothetical protein
MTSKIFRLFAGAALAGVAALACSREVMDPAEEVNSTTSRTVVFHAMGSQTKAQFGQKDGETWPTLWTSHDSEVKLSLNYGGAIAAAVTPSEDFRSASFSATIDFSEFTASYTYYSVSPSSVAKALSPSREAWKVSIPSVQTPSAGSPDERALIIASTSETYPDEDAASNVNLYFNHLTAYGCISITGLDLSGKTVQAVEITATQPFVGDWYWKCENHELIDYGASSTLTINTNHADQVWFGCAPVDMSNEIWVVSLVTDAGTYKKEILLEGSYELQAGVVAVLSVNMSVDTDFIQAGSGSGDFELVADASTLAVGDEVLITDIDGTYAMADNAGNYRNAVSITTGNNVISSVGDACILTLSAGSADDTWAFHASDGYLNATSSKNSLGVANAISETSSWAVSIVSGEATVDALSGSYNRLRYNYNQGAPRFSAYGSSTGLPLVSIYRRSAGGVSAHDPLLEKTNYGCYLGSGLEWEYNPGTDQVTRSYNGESVQTYTLINAENVEELEMIGYQRDKLKGDSFSVSVNWRRGTSSVHNSSYNMTVIKEDGPKVWLSAGNGKGVIIKK